MDFGPVLLTERSTATLNSPLAMRSPSPSVLNPLSQDQWVHLKNLKHSIPRKFARSTNHVYNNCSYNQDTAIAVKKTEGCPHSTTEMRLSNNENENHIPVSFAGFSSHELTNCTQINVDIESVGNSNEDFQSKHSYSVTVTDKYRRLSNENPKHCTNSLTSNIGLDCNTCPDKFIGTKSNLRENLLSLEDKRSEQCDHSEIGVRESPISVESSLHFNIFKIKRVNSGPKSVGRTTTVSVSDTRKARYSSPETHIHSQSCNYQKHWNLMNQTTRESSIILKEQGKCSSSENIGNLGNFSESDLIHSASANSHLSNNGRVINTPENGDDCITTVILNRPNMMINNTRNLPQDNRSRTCCFCWCCCCSCSCMRVRANVNEAKRSSPTDDAQSKADETGIGKTLTHEEVVSWADSFDLLMQSPAGRKLFRHFLRSEYSEENIMFWLACEELKKETNPELVEEKARMIYEDFISILSPREVSLDSRVREIINANMIEPTPGTFDEAQMQIYTLMHRDSYLRFLNSKVYKDLLQQTAANHPEVCDD